MVSHRGLFCLSNWMLTDANGVTELHSPVGEYGDYLDIEWHFVYGTSTSIELESLFCENSVKRIVVCEDSDTQSIHTTLHLSPAFKDVKVAVYQKGCADILQWAESTHLYHDICIWGPGASMQDAWFLKRAYYGKKVNYLYDRAYNNPSAKDAD